MIKLLPSQLAHAARHRAEGYADALRARAKILPTHLELSAEDFTAVNALFPVTRLQSPAAPEPRPETTPIPPKAKPATPLWAMTAFGMVARGLIIVRSEQDKGVGDTLARLVGPIGGEAYKAWFKKTFGKSCGCSEDQAYLNEKFPYDKTP